METLLLKHSEQDIEKAAAILKSGGLVAMPTETVYGLSANALDEEAVKKIFLAKGRPADNPLIVHVAAFSDIERLGLVKEIPDAAKRLFERFSPGPLTVIMKKSEKIPDAVSAGLDTVAIRIPSHPTARALLKASGLPLAAPSANASGRPSPTCAEHVMEDMDSKIEAVLDGGTCDVGVESTVITVVGGAPKILRPGLITKEEIEAVIGETRIDRATLSPVKENEAVASPGMKYKHYAPKADVTLVRAEDLAFIRLVNKSYTDDQAVAALCYDEDIKQILSPALSLGRRDDPKTQAQRLFSALRRIDALDHIKTVFARYPDASGVGLAVLNRLIRAAAFRVLTIPDKRMIGLTGLTGAGKGELSQILREWGFSVIDCDLLAHEAIEDEAVKTALAEAFGDVLNNDGTINRRKLANLAFSSPEQKATLNAITHPKIVELMLSRAGDAPTKTVVFDAPTLFDAGAHVFCDLTVAVLAHEKKRIARIKERDALTEEEAKLRIAAQKSEDFFRQRCDFIIENDFDLDALREQALTLKERLTNEQEI